MNTIKIKILFFLQKIVFRTLNLTKILENNVKVSGLSRGLKNVTFEGSNALWERCYFSGNIKVGYGTTFGFNDFIAGNVTIGKYCQLDSDVAIHSTNHPINHLSTYINRNLFDGELAQFREMRTITIGHDVWIVHNALIIGEIEIRNGAIIAAGSVVTKNVHAYSVVAGVPARVIKMRFNNNIVKQVEELEWWNKSKEELEKIKPLFFKDLSKVTDLYEGDAYCTS